MCCVKEQCVYTREGKHHRRRRCARCRQVRKVQTRRRRIELRFSLSSIPLQKGKRRDKRIKHKENMHIDGAPLSRAGDDSMHNELCVSDLLQRRSSQQQTCLIMRFGQAALLEPPVACPLSVTMIASAESLTQQQLQVVHMFVVQHNADCTGRLRLLVR